MICGRFPKSHSFHIHSGPLIVFLSFTFPPPIHVHWHCKCSKLLLQNHGNVLQSSSKFDFFRNSPPSPNRPFWAALIRWSTFMWVPFGGEKKPLFCQAFHPFGWACCCDCGKHYLYTKEIRSMHLLSFYTGFMNCSAITFSAETVWKVPFISVHGKYVTICSTEGF